MLVTDIHTGPALLKSTAADLMTANPLSFERSTPIPKAWALLEHHELQAAPVVCQGIPVGLVTKAACEAWYEFSQRSQPQNAEIVHSDSEPVSTIMTPGVDTVFDDAPIDAVIRTLVRRRIPRAFVVDESGELVGVLSMRDILRRIVET